MPLSGWYWQVTRLDPGKTDVRSSRSLWDGGLPHLRGLRHRAGPGRLARRAMSPVPRISGCGWSSAISISATRAIISSPSPATPPRSPQETRSFDQALIITFSILAAVLLLTTMFQVRFGLAPLKRITDSLAAIRSGSAERLAGKFPEEIAPLARETNALIDANKEIVERARTHVGNLAHALKTPLSVMVNEATARGGDPFARKVLEQADIMRDQVARHLERARLAARLHGRRFGHRCRAGGDRARAHDGKDPSRPQHLAIEVHADEQARFHGERPDLEEMIGNLVDNACKWASSRVAIEVVRERPRAASERHVRAHRRR